MIMLTRRTLLACGAAFIAFNGSARAQARPKILVHKDPNCGCCEEWAAHLRKAGFNVTTQNSTRMNAIKAKLGVPAELASCHTAEVNGYVIEGHVPAAEITRLVSEKPKAKGLAVAGMPIGSPGMEGGEPDTYDVVIFGEFGHQTFARYRGAQAI